jgi:hypothetical protein
MKNGDVGFEQDKLMVYKVSEPQGIGHLDAFGSCLPSHPKFFTESETIHRILL